MHHRFQQLCGVRVVRADLDAQPALRDGVVEDRRTEVGGRAVPEVDSIEPGFGEDDRGVRGVGVVELREAGVTGGCERGSGADVAYSHVPSLYARDKNRLRRQIEGTHAI